MLIFISYESSDKKLAYQVCDYLEGRGLKCWIAPRNIHAGEYAGAISRAIKSAEIIVVVCSSRTPSSSHVKNEISLAFDGGCTIIPLCYEDASLDDCMEYYFAGKQKVFLGKDRDRAFENLYAVISGNPVADVNLSGRTGKADVSRKVFRRVTFVLVAIVTAVVASIVVLRSIDDKASMPSGAQAQTEQIVIHDTVRIDRVTPVPPPADKHPIRFSDSFTGKTSSGYPDGTGTYTFGKDRRIDMHDERERVALKGDYIVGEWKDGHLIQGKWYGADGTVKGMIILGRISDTSGDKIFERCAN